MTDQVDLLPWIRIYASMISDSVWKRHDEEPALLRSAGSQSPQCPLEQDAGISALYSWNSSSLAQQRKRVFRDRV
jgi:hypothetical protein